MFGETLSICLLLIRGRHENRIASTTIASAQIEKKIIIHECDADLSLADKRELHLHALRTQVDSIGVEYCNSFIEFYSLSELFDDSLTQNINERITFLIVLVKQLLESCARVMDSLFDIKHRMPEQYYIDINNVMMKEFNGFKETNVRLLYVRDMFYKHCCLIDID